MRFRCPYCGEASFSAGKKLGIESKHIRRNFLYFLMSYCPNCGELVWKKASTTGKSYIFFYIAGVFFAAILIFGDPIKNLMFFIFGTIVSYIVFLISIYFITHYDFVVRSEREERDNIIIEFTDGVPFRKNTNEYVCELKFDKSRGIEKTYVIYDDKYKGDDKTLKFCMVVGRTPAAKDKIKIITHTGGVFVGVVRELIPRVPLSLNENEETSNKLEQVKGLNTSRTKSRKRWQDPDYFN